MILEMIAISIAVLISIPLIVLGTECLIVLLFDTKSPPCPVTLENPASYKILIPAHNEADIIGKTLAQLINQLPSNAAALVLIADNCTDNTANIARSLGVTVLERHDTAHRGKGFALDFGIQHLKVNGHPDVLIIIDADCETTQSSIDTLVDLVATKGTPAQMTNIMRVIENASIKQKIAGFAWLLKNKIRTLLLKTCS